jgi:apolipoprotein N-acyltransferase
MTAARPPGRLRRVFAGRSEAGRGRLWLAAALGAGLALGQAPWGLWWLALPALAGLLALVAAAPGWRAAAWLGWAGGTGHFAAALFWIVEPFLVDPARHGWMAPFALAAMAGGLALFWSAAAGLGHRLAPGRGLRAPTIAAALAASELARGHVLTGFPWALPGHIWLDTPLAQLAAGMGASGLTALTLAAAGVLALASSPARAATLVALVAAAGSAGWLWGAARLDRAGKPQGEPLQLRLVQPNIPQHLKWRPDLTWVFFDRQLSLSAQPSDVTPDVVIWSETAIPWLLDDAAPALPLIAEAAGGAPAILGVQRAEAGRFFNSLAVLDPDGAPVALYDKHHLVPFGEYIPFAELLAGTPVGGLAGQALLGYSPGPGPVVLDLGPLGRVLPLICYEAVFPQHLRTPDRPDWVLQLTNDAWFGRAAGPFQHLAQARFRAIEQGLPLVRAANTGVSAVIDPKGRIVADLGLGRTGVIDAALPVALPPTAFARWGEAPLALVLAGLLAGLAGRALLRRRAAAIDAAGARG